MRPCSDFRNDWPTQFHLWNVFEVRKDDMKNLSDVFGERLLHVPRPMMTKKNRNQYGLQHDPNWLTVFENRLVIFRHCVGYEYCIKIPTFAEGKIDFFEIRDKNVDMCFTSHLIYQQWSLSYTKPNNNKWVIHFSDRPIGNNQALCSSTKILHSWWLGVMG